MRWQVLVLTMTLLGSGTRAATAAQPSPAPSAAASPAPSAAPSPNAADVKTKGSYLMGLRLGTTVKQQLGATLDDIEMDSFTKGIKDGVAGAEPAVPRDQIEAIWDAFMSKMQAKKRDANREAAAKNQKEGDAFLAENKTKPGVVTLPSGLQYKVIADGKGPSPKASDTVTTHYKGTLIGGKEFDSSMRHGGPASFPVGRVIKGWTEALQRMRVGSKWQLFVPPQLAYGDHGAPPDIGPNATLIFEVELLAIK